MPDENSFEHKRQYRVVFGLGRSRNIDSFPSRPSRHHINSSNQTSWTLFSCKAGEGISGPGRRATSFFLASFSFPFLAIVCRTSPISYYQVSSSQFYSLFEVLHKLLSSPVPIPKDWNPTLLSSTLFGEIRVLQGMV